MPNWCQNTLKLEHDDPEFIRRAHSAFIEGKFLNEFVPVPEELTNPDTTTHGGDNAEAHDALRNNMAEKYGYSDWYSFCVNEWGTKWDVGADGQVVEINGNTFSASFQSAWGPPIQAFEKLEEMGFTVSAYYYEPGMGFCGMFAEGFDDYFEIGDMTADEVADLLPDTLDAMFNISEDIAMWAEENAEEEQE